MADHPYAGTVAVVRRALDRRFTNDAPAGDAWRGRVGPGEVPVTADVVELPGSSIPLVRLDAPVATQPLDAALAHAIALEQAELSLGRLAYDDGSVVATATLLGGPTLDVEEAVTAAYAIASSAAGAGGRIQARLEGRDPAEVPHPFEDAHIRVPRDADERLARAEGYVERLLTSSFGGFQRDPAWGYNGPFGSARVFVDVRPFLGESTVVRVASPVLSGIDLTGELALRALALASAAPFGRFSYLAERRELWFEHTLLGDALDPAELELAVSTVARVADGEDDALAQSFGGKRYADLVAEG
jgi:hypothetical protein